MHHLCRGCCKLNMLHHKRSHCKTSVLYVSRMQGTNVNENCLWSVMKGAWKLKIFLSFQVDISVLETDQKGFLIIDFKSHTQREIFSFKPNVPSCGPFPISRAKCSLITGDGKHWWYLTCPLDKDFLTGLFQATLWIRRMKQRDSWWKHVPVPEQKELIFPLTALYLSFL